MQYPFAAYLLWNCLTCLRLKWKPLSWFSKKICSIIPETCANFCLRTKTSSEDLLMHAALSISAGFTRWTRHWLYWWPLEEWLDIAAWDKATQWPPCAALNWEQRRGLYYTVRYVHVTLFQSDFMMEPWGCIEPCPLLRGGESDWVRGKILCLKTHKCKVMVAFLIAIDWLWVKTCICTCKCISNSITQRSKPIIALYHVTIRTLRFPSLQHSER